MKTFCPLPWMHQSVRTNGSIRICCAAESSKSKGLLRKENGEIFNAKSDSLDEARNATQLKQTRLDMLSGKYPESCSECKEKESFGVRSLKKSSLKLWGDKFNLKQAQEKTASDGSIKVSEVPLLQYDLRLGNTCNLKCRMCYPTSSHSWYDNYVQVWGREYFSDSSKKIPLTQKTDGSYISEVVDYNWTSDSQFWENIEKNIHAVQRISFAGGEPLLIKRHYELLEKIVANDLAKNITLRYMTNLTRLPKKALNLWSKFSHVVIGVSLDGLGTVNDYIRHPSRFEEISENIDQLTQEKRNMHTWIETTVQAYNILHLPQLMKWGLTKYFKKAQEQNALQIINPNLLREPHYLNVRILPPSYKNQVQKKFEAFSPWLRTWCDKEEISVSTQKALQLNSKKKLEKYLNYMNSEDWSHLLPQFMNYTEKLDKIRGEKMSDALPELHDSVSSWLSKPVEHPSLKNRA